FPAPTALLLAWVLAEAGDREKALTVLYDAAARHPGDVRTNYTLAANLERGRPARTMEAIRFYSIARALRPETAHHLAHLLAGSGQESEAEAIFRDLVARRPEDPRHLGCAGRFLQERGRSEEAAALLYRAIATGREAIRLRPDRADAHVHLGNALKDQG